LSGYGDFLEVVERNSGVTRVDKNSGAASIYVNVATLNAVGSAHTFSSSYKGTTLPVSLSVSGIGTLSAGEYALFDSGSGNVVVTTGTNSASVLIPKATLQSTFGVTGTAGAGALTFDSSGNLYFSNYTSGTATYGNVYRRKTDGTIEQVLAASDIKSSISASSYNATPELFAAPDGYIYGVANSNKSIFRWDGTPSASVEWVLDGAAITSVYSPAGVNSLGWYEGKIGFNLTQQGFFVTPEPATVAFLALGAMGTLRRRVRQ
jgi:hypothetical protein